MPVGAVIGGWAVAVSIVADGYRLSAIGYRLSAIGYRLSAIGYRLKLAVTDRTAGNRPSRGRRITYSPRPPSL